MAVVAAAMALLIAPMSSAMAEERAAPGRVEVEAAYLINFLRYTQWPQASFDNPNSPYVITVVGAESTAQTMRAVARLATAIDGRAIEVRWLPDARGSLAVPLTSAQDQDMLVELRHSHLVFFDGSANGGSASQAVAALWGQPVLTVSDAPGFVAAGGMIGLVQASGHIVFEANPVAIRNCNLMLSAKVLKLARIVRSDTR